jgi:hypothetical protein
MPVLPGFSSIAGVSIPDATVSYVGNVVSTANLTTYTFTAAAIGAAANDRHVIVGVFQRNVGTLASVNSVTLGGVAMSQAVQNAVVFDGGSVVGFWILAVPAGTTANIVVSLASGSRRCAITVFSARGLQSSTPTATAVSTTGASPSLNLNVEKGGIVLGMMWANNSATIAWTGLAENAEFTAEDDLRVSVASGATAVAQTPRSVSVVATTPSAPGYATACAVAFR